MKRNKITLGQVLFMVKLFLVLLAGGITLEIVLIITANLGTVWNSELHRFTMESIFLFIVFLSVGTLLVTIISKNILKPFQDLQNGIREVSKGNFQVKINYKQNDEFAEVIKCFNQMVVELNGIQTLRNDFINAFSHECKTPISSIRGFAKQLKRTDLLEEEKDEYLDIIISEADRLTHLYQNILSLCRYRNQEFLTNQEIFSMDEQIRRCILLFEKEWEKKDLDLDIKLDNIDYYGNEEMLRQVWINILSNAIKFSNPEGCIHIRCFSARKRIIVRVQDEGIGMNVETQNHMFEQFYSGETKENFGNGIGLAIVERIIELHEGKILVKSRLGEGTDVIVELPKRTQRKQEI